MKMRNSLNQTLPGCGRLLQYRLQIDQMLIWPAAVHGAMSYGQIAALLIKLG